MADLLSAMAVFNAALVTTFYGRLGTKEWGVHFLEISPGAK